MKLREDAPPPNAKSLLQVLRARCGKRRSIAFAKATLAAVMSRSARTIRRYIADLERFGYITTAIRKTGRGLHTGLVVTLTDKTVPFLREPEGPRRLCHRTPAALDAAFIGRVLGNHGVTKLLLKTTARLCGIETSAGGPKAKVSRRFR